MQPCSFPAHTLIIDVRNLILSCSSNY